MSDSDSDSDIPNRFDDSNRAFLQAFLARGTMTFREAQQVLAAIFTAQDKDKEDAEVTEPGQVAREDFESFVSAASAAVSPFDMEIRSATHQVTKERVYALVNTTSDPVTQLATLHSAEEIAFVRRVIDAMFDKYNSPRMEVLCLDGMQANKLRTAPRNEENNNENAAREDGQGATQSLKGLKSSEVEQVMHSMVDEGWFERSREGFYSLSPRALMELRQWLVDAYNDPDAAAGEWQRIKFCEACREIVTIGQRCAERDCCVRLHDICQEAFWKSRREEKCPRCKREWDGQHFVGERAITETEAYQRGRRRSGRGGRGGAAGRRSSLVGRIMEDDEGEDEG
ncbi:Nse1 non-SMC component of SMC5-6 complex-domain-containing protein [Hypoxylon crocopeplum]|nr:Nse1 non-SMC component of SMC5-6 complex-domain-containing protein [Hypoxylon crocopeplum]